MAPPKKYITTVKEIEQFRPDIRIVKFTFDGIEEFEFVPGSFVMLWIDGYNDERGNTIRRAYSIASAPKKDYLEICFKIEDLGAFSEKVKNFKVGDKVNMQGPFAGFFILKPEHNPLFIAAGTGIAPIMSMIRNKTIKTTLIYGIRTDKDYIYQQELEQHKEIKRVICVSRQKDTKYNYGRIDKKILQENVNDLSKDIFICGPASMVKQTVNDLKEIGFVDNRIHIDKWG